MVDQYVSRIQLPNTVQLSIATSLIFASIALEGHRWLLGYEGNEKSAPSFLIIRLWTSDIPFMPTSLSKMAEMIRIS